MKGLGDRCFVKYTVEVLPQVPKSILLISSVQFQTVNFCQITAPTMQAEASLLLFSDSSYFLESSVSTMMTIVYFEALRTGILYCMYIAFSGIRH